MAEKREDLLKESNIHNDRDQKSKKKIYIAQQNTNLQLSRYLKIIQVTKEKDDKIQLLNQQS